MSTNQEPAPPPGNPKAGICVEIEAGRDETRPGTMAVAPGAGTAATTSLPEAFRFFFPPRLMRATPPLPPSAETLDSAETALIECAMGSESASNEPSSAEATAAPEALRGKIPEPRLCSGCKNLHSLPSLHQPLDFQCRQTITLFSAPEATSPSAGVVLRIAVGLTETAAIGASVTVELGVSANCNTSERPVTNASASETTVWADSSCSGDCHEL
mmetsp:Transcript_82823/g.208593  ORF Transcript_82823/g.208593 Transcript_82823/m.208593 type:complete len:215 (+) Transcript_82823:437-1081(+)